MCHVSRVTCHVSPVTCHVSPVTSREKKITLFLLLKKNYIYLSEKIGQNGGASRWRVCFHRGLPRLVYKLVTVHA